MAEAHVVARADAVAPTEATPIAPRLDPSPAVGERYSAVGYGATSPFGTDNDRRRRRDDRVVQCVASGCFDGRGNPNEWVGDEGPCGGDSGGPALDLAGRVIGVMSRGAVSCAAPTYTLLTPYRDWLATEALRVSRAAGSAPPAWAGGVSDAGVTDAGVADVNTPDTNVSDASATDGDAPDSQAADASATDASLSVARDAGGCRVASSSAKSGWNLGVVTALVFALVVVTRRGGQVRHTAASVGSSDLARRGLGRGGSGSVAHNASNRSS